SIGANRVHQKVTDTSRLKSEGAEVLPGASVLPLIERGGERAVAMLKCDGHIVRPIEMSGPDQIDVIEPGLRKIGGKPHGLRAFSRVVVVHVVSAAETGNRTA